MAEPPGSRVLAVVDVAAVVADAAAVAAGAVAVVAGAVDGAAAFQTTPIASRAESASA